MLPPIIPLSAAPVTSQQDPVKPTPDIKPVVPTQPASGESAIDLKRQRDMALQRAQRTDPGGEVQRVDA